MPVSHSELDIVFSNLTPFYQKNKFVAKLEKGWEIDIVRKLLCLLYSIVGEFAKTISGNEQNKIEK